MHELSVALEVCRIAEEQVAPGRLGDLVTVGLEVGRDSCVEVANLEFCLEALLTHPPFRRGRPVIETVGGEDVRVSYLEVDDGDSPH